MPRARRLLVPLLLAPVLLTACTPDAPPRQNDQRRDTSTTEAAPSTEQQRPLNAKPGSAGGGEPYYPTDGNGGYDVRDYNVKISYRPDTHKLDGDTTVTAKATQDLSRFNLDLKGLTVREVTVDNIPADAFRRTGDHELVIRPAAAIRKGKRFAVRVTYDGVPGTINDAAFDDGGWTISPSGGAFVAGQPHGATTWYPANDVPSDKATFHLTATVPKQWTVVSNGIPGKPRTSGGTRTFTWAEETPLTTYLTTVGIDKWGFSQSKLDDGTPVLDAYAPGAEGFHAIEDRLPEILSFLESKFGDYPQRAAGAIALGQSIGYSLEIQTRPIFSKGIDLLTVVHENAHQWYGDSVSVRNWKDICLNECFAQYAMDLWSEEKDGADIDAKYRSQVASYGADFWAGRLYDMGAGNEFSSVYTKGPLALHALRREIGDKAFFATLKGWPQKHKHGNASWPQFERYVQQVSGKDLSGFLRAWFRSGVKPPAQYLYPGSLAN